LTHNCYLKFFLGGPSSSWFVEGVEVARGYVRTTKVSAHGELIWQWKQVHVVTTSSVVQFLHNIMDSLVQCGALLIVPSIKITLNLELRKISG